jgi:hypothetical protein
VDQIGGGHDFHKFGRTSLGSQRCGKQEEYIHIVDRVHGLAFE